MKQRAWPVETFIANIGREIGLSDWISVDQERIDGFAKVTEDAMFLHVDPERARATPFGGTIAHGFLTLSLLAPMSTRTLPGLEGATMGVNYGFDRVRFLSPVRSGKRIRGRFMLKAFEERQPGQWVTSLAVTVEIEGEERPAITAEWMLLSFT